MKERHHVRCRPRGEGGWLAAASFCIGQFRERFDAVELRQARIHTVPRAVSKVRLGRDVIGSGPGRTRWRMERRAATRFEAGGDVRAKSTHGTRRHREDPDKAASERLGASAQRFSCTSEKGSDVSAVRTRRARSPIRYLSIAWLFTLAVLIAFLWCAFDSYERFTKTADQNLRIQRLRGEIIHLDEVLTMSARLCTLTGDTAWCRRYREFEPKLEGAIREVMTYSIGARTSGETDQANEALVGLEHRALDLAEEGKFDEARALLFSDEYGVQKAVYSAGMDALGRQLDESAAEAMRAERGRIYFQLGAGAVVIALLLAGWVVVVRVASQSARVRGQLDKVERDLDIAREIQRGLLPREAPEAPGFEIEGWSKPADQTGGDYFDWMALPDGGILITLADVTGHGIGPALIVSVCRAYMRASAGGDGVALGAAISRVNDLLQVDLPPSRFVTAAVGILRPEGHEMSLVSAGQAPMFFYHAATRTVENWDADEPPLGIAPDLEFGGSRRMRFEPGDALVLATDGFFEWANARGEQYGIRRLEAFVRDNGHEAPQSFIQALHAEVVGHAAGRPQPDDLTVVIVKRKPAAVPSGSGQVRAAR